MVHESQIPTTEAKIKPQGDSTQTKCSFCLPINLILTELKQNL